MDRATSYGLSFAFLFAAVGCGGEGDYIETDEFLGQSEPIINGDIASQSLVDRQGALYIGATGGFAFQCGATYIGQNGSGDHWVLTAAHCVEATTADYLVAFGKAQRSEYTTADTVSVEQVIIHPSYVFGTVSQNDIALLRVSGQPNATVSDLATFSTDAPVDDTVSISGFGSTGFSSSDVLLSATTRVISTAECQSFFGQVDDSQICILDDIGTPQNACNGDSGGPMFRSNLVQVGLTSFGQQGCPTSVPSVYTRVSAFRSWIQSNSGI
ncbi:MAG: serine protease [Myxococcota bacterium]